MSSRVAEVAAAFGFGPFDTIAAGNWVVLTRPDNGKTRAMSPMSWRIGRDNEFDHFPAGSATVTLWNRDRALDPDNTSSPYNGNLVPLVPVRIRSQDVDTLAYTDEFYGFVENGWEQSLAPKGSGVCRLVLTDLLGVIAGRILPGVLEAEIMADSPVAYWPLDEVAGGAMRDATGSHGDGEYVHGTTELSRSAVTLAGGSVRGFELDGEHWGQTRDATTVLTTRPICIECVFRPPDSLPAAEILYRSGTGNANEGSTVQISASGATGWTITSATRDGAADDLAASTAFSLFGAQGAIHHFVHRRPSVGAAQIWIDGSDATNTNTTAPSNGIAVAPGTVVGSADYQSGGQYSIPSSSAFKGFLAHVAVYNTDIGTTRIAAHASAALAPLDGLRSDEQVAWALDRLGVPAGLRNLDTGTVIMGPADTKGRDALEWMRDVTATEGGGLYVDHRDGGKIRFTSRYVRHIASRSTTTQATFSDLPGAVGVIRYPPEGLDIAPYGRDGVINQAAVRWIGGEIVYEDATSVATYGPRGRTVETLATTANQARSVAEWIVAQNKDPRTRIRGAISSDRATHSRNDLVETLKIDDRVTFRVHPLRIGDATTVDLHVDGITHQFDGLVWETSFRFAQIPGFTPWIWGTGAWGTTAFWG